MSFLNSPRARSALLMAGEPLKDETVSERRSRTRNVSKELAKIEAVNAEATKKLEEAKKKKQ
jgi:hypothetical protein